MIQDTQRMASVHTVLPDGELVFYAMAGRETLGRPFSYELKLLSENPNVNLSQLLGEPISVELKLPDERVREFNGVVSHCAFEGFRGRHALYHVSVRPWLWLMEHRIRSRIFQSKTVPEVLEELFREHGFSDFENALSESYRRFEYLVQYRESDFNFVSRLMELEGIYCFFKHQDRQHKLILADSYSAHEAAAGYESVPYFPPHQSERRERDHVSQWQVRRALRPAAYMARDFNFTRPAAPLSIEQRVPLEHAYNEYEVYDYPGQFLEPEEADVQGRIRLEELQADFEIVNGEGNAHGLGCGGLFSLTQYPREDQNQEYLIIDATYDIGNVEYESWDEVDGPPFHVRFVAIPSCQPYRTPRTTRKPLVEGPQTATVVGQDGQEIWTDEYGRVRLHFHWDREGLANETSSCWVRVSQAWAGTNWGSIHIPRIGQEVIVSFLEGDPDRPIVTGRVYNADNMPPYELPTNQTQSGIKSRSTKDGTPDNFNEIRFEDKKGEEELFMQAEKNMTVTVKQNQSTSTGANRSASVGANDSVSVTGDRSVTVEKTHTVTVTAADTETYKNTRDVTVTGPDTLTITKAHTGNYNNSRTLTIKGPDSVTVQSVGKTNTVTGKYAHSATVEYVASQGESNSLSMKGTAVTLTNGKCTVKLDGGNLSLEAPDQIQLKVGGSTITLTTSAIDVAGTKVTLNGGASIELAAAGATVTGAKVSVAGDATTEIRGAMVKIN